MKNKFAKLFKAIIYRMRHYKGLRNNLCWHNLRNIHPVSECFGFDRGTPVDRYYINTFFTENEDLIRGHVLEIADNTYSSKFGKNITKFEILHPEKQNKRATLIGDLTKINTLPKNQFDCFICTQTLNVIYDFKKAIEGSYYLLKSGGVMLGTVAGLCQISKYDMDRWGDYWRFTDMTILRAFGEIFGERNVKVKTYGNVLSALALLEGISAEELTKEELDYTDNIYQVLITIRAWKE